MLNPNTNLIRLSSQEYIIYSKHLIVENIGLNGQKRLKKAKILVIGAGGLGSPAMLYLATSGIGYIGICEYDDIDLSNLNRQILYNLDDIDQNKTVCAKNRLKQINSNYIIITHDYQLKYDNAFELIQYYDIILDTSDNFQTKYIIDQVCYQLNKIHIYGAVEQFIGQIGVFNYKNNNRYVNIYSEKNKIIEKTCNNDGILGTITANIGILQATEAIKIILGIGQIINKYILICNLLNTSFQKIRIYNFKNNQNNHNNTYNLSSKIIKNKDFYYLKHIKHIIFLILDIRSSKEFRQKHIRNAINIKIQHIKIKKTLTFLKKYSYNKMIVIYCNNVSRSIIISNILNNYHINHYILNIKEQDIFSMYS